MLDWGREQNRELDDDSAHGIGERFKAQAADLIPKTLGYLLTSSRRQSWRSRIAEAFDRECRYGHDVFFVPVFLGMGAALWFSLRTPPRTDIIAALAILALIGRWLGGVRGDKRRPGAVAALILSGMLCAAWETDRQSTIILDQPVVTEISGVVERREAGSSTEWRYIITLHETARPTIRRAPQRISLLARARHAPVPIGATIAGRARLSPPSGPALPGMNDFAFQSFYAQIGAIGYFLGAPKSIAAKAESETSWATRVEAWQYQLRDRISNRIREILPGDTGGFAASIITGERRSMSREATEALRLSGLAHITAISGLNMALAAGIFFVGARRLLSLIPFVAQAFPIKKLAALGALFAITGYVMISGYQVSAVRAYLMTAVMLSAVLIDRPAISLRNLCLAATIMIACQPSIVLGPSFQMSFAATAALISGYARWTARPPSFLPKAKGAPARLALSVGKLFSATFLTSVIGALSTAVFSIWHFHRLSTHGLEANLAAMPLISLLVMPAGFLAMLAMPLGLDEPFFHVMGFGLDLVLDVAHTTASWGEGIAFERMPPWFILGAIAGLLLLTLLRTWLRLAGGLIFLLTALAAATVPTATPADLFVSEDARLVALWAADQKGAAAVNRLRPSAFLYDQWRPVLGIRHTEFPIQLAELRLPQMSPRGELLTATAQEEARVVLERLVHAAVANRFTCVKGACSVLVYGNKILTMDRPDVVGQACDLADIVVLAARSSVQSCRSGAILLTESSLRSSGALEIWIDPESQRQFTIRPSFEGRPFPWTSHRLYDWRTATSAENHGMIHPKSERPASINDSDG
ncbi:ComEC/Rec2 family competence protein [Peteryoungia ipomoeae]|uniref:ComEC family competence protein n=1 Tax=Peteryoungia ipomoeae TaxID=1210932 RepID=A0A4S8P522_9HYPH|nr:ComEC/Rec2 family competence protein [Peteryoungia ipomoeae]THV25240.1 ComEC family competence protein [Peteryoungia ipomoeae]